MGVIAICGVVFLGVLTAIAVWLLLSDQDDSEASYWDDLEAARGEYRSDRTEEK